MLLFGDSPWSAALSSAVLALLGAKLVATVVLLAAGREARDCPGWGAALWWTTKLAPVLAAPCLLVLAWRSGSAVTVALFAALALFVAVAVPVKVRQRRARLARRAGRPC